MESTITSKLATNSSKLFETYQFLTPNYWFGTPEALSLDRLLFPELLATAVFVAVLLFIAYRFTNKSLTPPENKFLSKVILYLVWFGPLGWLLVIFRNWGVVLLSARFLWVIWAITLLFLVIYLFRKFRSIVPNAKQTYLSYQVKKSYFPKKKKKK